MHVSWENLDQIIIITIIKTTTPTKKLYNNIAMSLYLPLIDTQTHI